MRQLQPAIVALLCALCVFGGIRGAFAKGRRTEQHRPKPFCFIQISDPQLGFAAASKNFDLETKNMEKAVRIINRLKPDFVIITGDFVNDCESEAQWIEFRRLLHLVDPAVPVYLIPGNHDMPKIRGDEGLLPYLSRFGYDRFAFEHKGCTFIGLNSNLVKDGVERLEKEQFAWLRGRLKHRRKTGRTFIFTHCPVFSRRMDEKETYSNFSVADRARYMDLFVRYGVDGIFAGHLHHHRHTHYHGVQLVTAGAVTRALGEGGFSGMNLVKVYPDKFVSEFLGFDQMPSSIVF